MRIDCNVWCRGWTLGLVCCLLASTAMADEEGPYVTIQAGPSTLRNACDNPWFPYVATMGPPGPCSERNLAYRAGFGYQYTPMWGLEASFGTFGYAHSEGVVNFPPPPVDIGPMNYSWQLRARGLAIQAVATVHMGDVLSLVGKFGVARIEFDEYIYGWNRTLPPGYSNYYFTPVVNDKRNALALGGGVQFDLGPHGSIRLMVETFGSHDIYSIFGQTTKVQPVMGSFGLMYRY